MQEIDTFDLIAPSWQAANNGSPPTTMKSAFTGKTLTKAMNATLSPRKFRSAMTAFSSLMSIKPG
jgi:hypothetical protein